MMGQTVKGLYTYSKAEDIEAAFSKPVSQGGLGIKVSVEIIGIKDEDERCCPTLY